MLSRRDVVGKIAASGAIIVAAKAAGASMAPRQGMVAEPNRLEPKAPQPSVDIPEQPSALAPTGAGGLPETALAEAPWDLLRPLEMGSSLGSGWQVSGLTGAVDGTCVLTLQNERGRTHRIHLCRNDGRPQGLVFTDGIDLVVMNGGQGDLATDESLAQAIAQVAHVLAANERKQATVLAALLPHEERLRRFTGADHRLR
ncbi:hypothetical protein KF840_12510 [bacterium]|nr:hypothetical protein [bacterium]